MKWVNNNLRNINPLIQVVFDHFVELVRKGLRTFVNWVNVNCGHELTETRI